MSSKSKNMLRVVVGIYLIYLGASMIKDVFAQRPDYASLLILAGAVFVLVGAFFAYKSFRAYLADQKAEREEDARIAMEAERAAKEEEQVKNSQSDLINPEESSKNPEEDQAETAEKGTIVVDGIAEAGKKSECEHADGESEAAASKKE
ncbi:YgaP family membrane protein [Hespellia stercorisuis]|uniref:Uncharacterized protein n=1 Tax=Hespellia stercorisuis DSM 15480 TaxID=1121950 RepID=A0A1M6PFH1_9FIRM|nr:DUF2892 domain-containing protein [Hespellia stercorisuis]SHK06699.1 hypothetical protein SAMN02745243_02105 [Hespellia stercorisuis DSM 15480]